MPDFLHLPNSKKIAWGLSCTVLAVLLLASLNTGVAQSALVPFGAEWRFLDNGSDQGTLWRQSGFDDSNWPTGPAQLGYGDGDEATLVGFGPDIDDKYITTYFRHTFNLTDPGAIEQLRLEWVRDDGIVVYLNGDEVLRDNMPSGNIDYRTTANEALGGTDETLVQRSVVAASPLAEGANVLAVEIHQAGRSSSDISFDLRLASSSEAMVSRGPYLQNATSDSIVVRWRTLAATDSVVRYGLAPDALNLRAAADASVTEHSVSISGLNINTRYYYSIGDSAGPLVGGDDYFFDTHPRPGSVQATRIWAIGDSGTADANAAAVKEAFVQVNGERHTDVWLMLGDNAYNDGTDAEYQRAVFDMYPGLLRNTVLRSTLGNHDGHSADAVTQSGPYFDIFTLPRAGEAGGIASGTEAYYSFDYANIHFVCLDSYASDRSADAAMALWLSNDLAATHQEWIIAFWHHPPYSKGSHDSDTEPRLIDMRQVFLPILEDHGVDLVLSGHSHSYERSMLIGGHYGNSSTFNKDMVLDAGDGDPAGDGEYRKEVPTKQGAVYAVAGSSGKISGGSLDHPVMISNLNELGSLIIDVVDDQMDVRFINSNGQVRDAFRIRHDPATATTTPPSAHLLGDLMLLLEDEKRADGTGPEPSPGQDAE